MNSIIKPDTTQKAKWVECWTNNSSTHDNNTAPSINTSIETQTNKSISNSESANETIINNDEKSKLIKTDFTVQDAVKIAQDKYGIDEDTVYYYEDTLKYENGKRYYIIIPRSKSMMKSGGSGTLFRIKVFEDKTIIQ